MNLENNFLDSFNFIGKLSFGEYEDEKCQAT